MACICSRTYVLACMLCLIWGCDALALRRQEALVAPLWARSCLTIEECWRRRGTSSFLLDAPHATAYTHERLQTFTVQSKENKQTRHRQKACMCGENATSQRSVYKAVKYMFSQGPRPLLRSLLGQSFVKEPRGPCRGWLEHTWQFEPLWRSVGIRSNWLWRLAVGMRLEMVCCCALCIVWSFGSCRGRKGFFRNQWGGW